MPQYSSNKDIRKIVKKLLREGWIYRLKKKHGLIKSPEGGIVIIASSPSDRRALNNFIQDVRRCKKRIK